MKLINAGIKSKKEAAQRLIDGEVFYSDLGLKIVFDRATQGSPFRLGEKALSGLWDRFRNWQIEDPYAELKEAHAAGKVIEFKKYGGGYCELPNPIFTEPPELYRVKPEPKTVKKYIVTVVDGFVDQAEWVEVSEDE